AGGAAAVLAGPGLVDGQRPTVEFGAVEGGDRLLRTLGHLDEAEAARPAGLAVGRHLGPGHGAVLGAHLPEVVRGGREGQVADEKVLAHGDPVRASGHAVTGDPHGRHGRPRGRERTTDTRVRAGPAYPASLRAAGKTREGQRVPATQAKRSETVRGMLRADASGEAKAR